MDVKNLIKIFVLGMVVSMFLSLHVNAAMGAEAIISVADASGTHEGNISDFFNFDDVEETEETVEETVYDIDEGYRLYENFIDASAFLNDDNWKEWLRDNYIYPDFDETKITADLGIEKISSMTAYECFLYASVYLYLADVKYHENEQLYISTFNGVNSHYKSRYFKCPSVDEETKEKFTQAWEELILWQMGYMDANGGPFNFITGKSYVEHVYGDIGSNKPQEESITDKELEEVLEVFENEFSDEEKKEIVEAAKDYIEKENTTDIVPKVGDKNEKANTSDSLPILIIALVLFGVLVAIIVLVIAVVSKDKKVEDKSNNENN